MKRTFQSGVLGERAVTHPSELVQLQGQLCLLITEAPVQTPPTATRTVVLYLKKEIKSLKKMTLGQLQKSGGEIKIETTMMTMMGFLDQPFLLGLRSRTTLLQDL